MINKTYKTGFRWKWIPALGYPEEIDKKFDKGEDVSEHLDASKARVNMHFHRINIDFPELFIKRIDD